MPGARRKSVLAFNNVENMVTHIDEVITSCRNGPVTHKRQYRAYGKYQNGAAILPRRDLHTVSAHVLPAGSAVGADFSTTRFLAGEQLAQTAWLLAAPGAVRFLHKGQRRWY